MALTWPGDVYMDSGATASDNKDGNLTAQLTNFGVAAIDTTLPTVPDNPSTVYYEVADSAHNVATRVYRRITVICRQVLSNNAPLLA